MTEPPEVLRHPAAAVERGLEVLLVEEAHEEQVVLGSRRGLVVVGRSAQPDELALTRDRERGVSGLDEGAFHVSRPVELFF